MNKFSFNIDNDSENRREKLMEQLEWARSVYKARTGMDFVFLPFNWRYRDEKKKEDKDDSSRPNTSS